MPVSAFVAWMFHPCSIEPSKNSIFVSSSRMGEGRARAKARGVKLGRTSKLTEHQRNEAIERHGHGEETLAEIGRSYNVRGWTISRLRS